MLTFHPVPSILPSSERAALFDIFLNDLPFFFFLTRVRFAEGDKEKQEVT